MNLRCTTSHAAPLVPVHMYHTATNPNSMAATSSRLKNTQPQSSTRLDPSSLLPTHPQSPQLSTLPFESHIFATHRVAVVLRTTSHHSPISHHSLALKLHQHLHDTPVKSRIRPSRADPHHPDSIVSAATYSCSSPRPVFCISPIHASNDISELARCSSVVGAVLESAQSCSGWVRDSMAGQSYVCACC